ncbi:glycosyltransferase family protein [Agromyces sp. SYSU T00194]|uniref:glycosyltransferase family protein n=1 Tax=Agromyces chitinivorans TaxID=3158560 RepID=UPI00339AE30C
MTSTELPINTTQSELYRRLAAGEYAEGPRGTVAFCVSTDDLDEGKGDVYVALGLAKYLQRLGWGVRLWPARNWCDPVPKVDVAIAMIESFVPGLVDEHTSVVAWVRNWTERWVELPYLDVFDGIWASSEASAAALRERSGHPVEVVPIAVDLELFAPADDPVEVRFAAMTTVNFWGAEREIMDAIDGLTGPTSVMWFGANGEHLRLPRHAEHGGILDFFALPSAYAASSVVLDDVIGPAKAYGNHNSRLFESIAAGALPVTNARTGLAELGLADVPVYSDSATLDAALDAATGTAGPELAATLREVVRARHSYERRAETLDPVLAGLRERAARGTRRPSALLAWVAGLQADLMRAERERDEFLADARAVGTERNELRGRLDAVEAELDGVRAALDGITSARTYPAYDRLRRAYARLRELAGRD